MVKKIILDLEKDYIWEKQDFIQRMTQRYEMQTGDFILSEPEKTVVLTDKENAARLWKNYAVIGIEHGSKINYVPYIFENLEDVTDYDIRLAYGRKHNIPCVIGSNDKITLREASLEDMEALKHIYDKEENVRYIPQMDSIENEKDKLKSYIRYMYGYYGYGLWIIEDKDTGRLIGRAGIEHRKINGENYYELAYLVEKEYRRKGYGYQAAQMALDFAKQYGMKQIITYICEKNIPSIRLSEKLGFARWKETTDGIKKYVVYRKEL